MPAGTPLGAAAAPATGPAQAGTGPFCGHCGEQRDPAGPGARPAAGHERCDRAAALEPPRYCPHCQRRMVVQVTPTGWRARCSRHGEVPGAAS